MNSEAARSSAADKRGLVLVVDDNDANRALAEDALSDEGYEVAQAASGEAALASFGARAPDCVLLDVRMPVMDGFAVADQLRSMPGGAETPIVFLTALRDVETFDRALAVGGDDFLTKPVRPAELCARVQAAIQVKQLKAELKDQYELLKRQRDDLLRVQLQKERLMAFVVHDLKNPVSSIDLHAQLLERERGIPESAVESVRWIRSGASQLSRMIVNLLDLTKGDEGKLVPARTEVDLDELIRTVLDELALVAASRGVTLERDVDCRAARLDRDLFRRLLANLVENALRHAPVKSAVTVSTQRLGGHIQLRVRDRGNGVPKELREAIFQPFVQAAGGPSHSQSGRGLGLAFCKLVADAHGGKIEVVDAEPGASFQVTIDA